MTDQDWQILLNDANARADQQARVNHELRKANAQIIQQMEGLQEELRHWQQAARGFGPVETKPFETWPLDVARV